MAPTVKNPPAMQELLLLLLSRFSRVRLCATQWTAAHQAPPSLEFSRQEHWSGLPFPSLDSIPGLGRSSGVGNGHPLQYSGLENLMDRGAWLARVHGSQSWTQLSFKNLHLQQPVPRLVRIDLDVVFFNFICLKWSLSGSSYYSRPDVTQRLFKRLPMNP